MYNIGFRDPDCSRHPLEPLWCLGQDNSESHAGIGVTAVWPHHRLVMPTNRQPASISIQRCGAVGGLAGYGEEEVTQSVQSLILVCRSPHRMDSTRHK